jgi:hypothetical protein
MIYLGVKLKQRYVLVIWWLTCTDQGKYFWHPTVVGINYSLTVLGLALMLGSYKRGERVGHHNGTILSSPSSNI